MSAVPSRIFRLRGVALGVAFSVLPLIPNFGCGGGATPPAPSDPETARAVLQDVLASWKLGEAHDTLKNQTPPIHIADEDWRNGYSLVDFEVQGAGTLVGNSLRCPVSLSLQNPGGASISKDVVYTISTEPALSVVRQDDAE